jgi:hypothetical protein
MAKSHAVAQPHAATVGAAMMERADGILEIRFPLRDVVGWRNEPGNAAHG